MANNDYTIDLINGLRNHSGNLDAFNYLVSLVPDDDDFYQMIHLLSSSLNDSFSQLEKVSLSAVNKGPLSVVS